jgi:hypothetical protein
VLRLHKLLLETVLRQKHRLRPPMASVDQNSSQFDLLLENGSGY